MPGISIRSLRDAVGAAEGAVASFTAQMMARTGPRSYRAVPRVDGASVTFSTVVESELSGDVRVLELDVLPENRWWRLTVKFGESAIVRDVVFPDGEGPFDFGDLTVIDPETMGPYGPDPESPHEVLVAAEAARDAASESASAAALSAGSAAGAAVAAVEAADTGGILGSAPSDFLTPAQGKAAFVPQGSVLLVADGDSITKASVDDTYKQLLDSWHTYLCVLSDGRIPYVANVGHGGHTSAQLVELFDSEVLPNLPGGGILVWAAGRNDSSVSETANADREVLTRCQQAGIKLVLTTMVPTGVLPLPVPTGVTVTTSTSGGTLATGTYAYTVTALNNKGETTASSSVNASVTGPTGSVTVVWDMVPGATGYRVYRDAALVGSTTEGVRRAYLDTGSSGGAAAPGSNTTGEAPTAGQQEFLGAVRAWRRKFALENGIPLIDFYSSMTDPTTGYYKQGYTFDKIHPTSQAQKVLAEAAWDVLSQVVPPVAPPVTVSQTDATNIYGNGLFQTVVSQRPSGWTAMTTGHTGVVQPEVGFLGNAWTITRSDPLAATFTAEYSLSTGWSVGDILQFSAVHEREGEATGLMTIVGARFTGPTPGQGLGEFTLLADYGPKILVGPPVAVPSGTTSVRLRHYVGRGTGWSRLGQVTLRNLTTGAILDL